MAKIYFTADYHFGNPNILKYCKRPFKTVERMADVLIKFANQRAVGYFRDEITDAIDENGNSVRVKARVKYDADTLIHVGDFACYGSERGMMGNKINPREYVSKFNANLILLEGNHDGNNHVKNAARSLVLDIGEFHNVSVGHYPTSYEEAYGTYHTHAYSKYLGLHICGHVHKAWKHMYDEKHNILNINVGCDMWKYQVVSETDVFKYANRVRRELGI